MNWLSQLKLITRYQKGALERYSTYDTAKNTIKHLKEDIIASSELSCKIQLIYHYKQLMPRLRQKHLRKSN